MPSGFNELAAEFLSILVYGGITSALAYGGLLSELTALQQYGAGEPGLAAWYLFMGVLALYGGVSILRDRLWPAVAGLGA